MPVCPHCGRESRATDRYCLHCGQRMDAEPGGDPDMLPAFVGPDRNGGWSSSQPGPMSGGRASAPMVAVRPQVIARLTLEPSPGSHEGPREYLLDGRDITIGRAPACDVVLANDQLASRRHTLLHFEGDRYTISDLGSSNGTYVNGTEIHDVVPLSDGDRIAVGEHDLVYARFVARNTDGFPIPVPPPWPPTVDNAPISGPMQGASTAGPAPSAAAPVSAAGPTPALMDHLADAAQSAPPQAALAFTAAPPAPPVDASLAQQLRMQLMEASEGLVRRVDDVERETARMRAAMAELEEMVRATLASLGATTAAALADAEASGEAGVEASAEASVEASGEAGVEAGGEAGVEVDAKAGGVAGAEDEDESEQAPSGEAPASTLDEIVRVTRQAAENPRHLDYLTALADHAGEIMRVLEAQRSTATRLEEIRQRLASFADEQ